MTTSNQTTITLTSFAAFDETINSPIKFSRFLDADATRLIADKFALPSLPAGQIARPRLREHLAKSLRQFNATILVGRAGTGKTQLSAEYARNLGDCKTAWYTIETADGDWNLFKSYLLGSVNSGWHTPFATSEVTDLQSGNSRRLQIEAETELLVARIIEAVDGKQTLLILDDAHKIFDAAWFAEFFHAFLPLLPSNIQLLILARSLPSFGLWRLRSKQLLGVIGENLLAFTVAEAVEMFDLYNLSSGIAHLAHRETFGRARKLAQTAETFCLDQLELVL